MLKNIIEKVNKEFVREAKSSPGLMEDMAAMEKYMAESYGERIFIELLQNADDANSTKIKVLYRNNHLFFANDGRPFNENDIISISRSGSSKKQRGDTIGYRGIGFKSTSYLTNDILIYSNKTYFTFSKERCAIKLGLTDINKVPTIRIPFLVKADELQQTNPEILETVNELSGEGYQSIFIFKYPNIQLINEEMNEVNNGYFIFLRNIAHAVIQTDSYNGIFEINRKDLNERSTSVSISGRNNEKWLLINDTKKVTIAFKLNESNMIVPCNEEEALFHCFLPSLEKTGYPFKINSDFSTDPSRKHLTYDEETEKSLMKAAVMLYQLITEAVNKKNELTPIISLMKNKTTFSKFSMKVSEELKQLLINNEWLELAKGELISPIDYKKHPSWLESSELDIIRKNSIYLSELSLPSELYVKIPEIDAFLGRYSEADFTNNDWVLVISDENFINSITPQLAGKIFGKLSKDIRLNKMMNKNDIDMKKAIIPLSGKPIVVMDLKDKKEITLDNDFKEGFMQSASVYDIEWFDKEFDTNLSASFGRDMDKKVKAPLVAKKVNNHISRWRAAEKQCVELEEIFGNTATDVSKQNLGYDIESKTPDGNTRYIEVKSLTNTNQFSMTNNEYTSAHQYKESYYICIIKQKEDGIDATYIQDPIHTLSMEKRVRQWEWYCDSYSGENFSMHFK